MLAKVIFTVFGLIIGFLAGLGTLNVILKDKTPEELRKNKDLHKKYGPICWIITLAGGFVGYWLTKFI